MHGLHEGEDNLSVHSKLPSPINGCCFVHLGWHNGFDIAHIEKEGLWDGIGQVKDG